MEFSKTEKNKKKNKKNTLEAYFIRKFRKHIPSQINSAGVVIGYRATSCN